MRFHLATLALLACTPVAAASAQSVFETHAEAAGPSGKLPTRAYRPVSQERCRTATNHHQTGKIPLTPQVAQDRSGCAVELAQRDTATRKE